MRGSIAPDPLRILAAQNLVAGPGRVFSRQQLMDKVWGEDGDSFDRTVDTHIKTLRAKLRAVNEELSPISTHRGMGYSPGCINAHWDASAAGVFPDRGHRRVVCAVDLVQK